MREFVKGDVVDNPPESIRLFAICEAIRFSHLPVPGGLYDQHPQLIDEWSVIFQERARQEKTKNERQMRKAEQKANRKRR